MSHRPHETLATDVQQRDVEEPPREGPFLLLVTAGPDKGKSFRVEVDQPTRVLLGTSPACAIRLTDREVSRRHAALDRVGLELRVTDLGSTNGTFVDRVKILQADLQGGEMLRMGTTVLRVEREGEGDRAEPELTTATSFGRMTGASREMRRLYPLCERLAFANVPVLIEGETGTGKEVLAEALHEQGPRAAGPFVVFDCTSVPPSLVESELFGHERGAFTGATATRKGVFEQAHGGTLLIDEIGDLDLVLQPKLLRALERLEFRRVGGEKWIHVDVRVMAATRRDLDREVQSGRFRDDLFHRLAVTRIELPPLRHRRGDVSALAAYFWAQLGGDPRWLTPDVFHRWEDYAWPGNVRELKNHVARQLALGELAVLPELAGESDDPFAAPQGQGDALDRYVESGLPFPEARDRLVDEFQQRYVARLLEMHGGDVAKAAAASGIGRRYFQKLKARTTT